MTKEAEMNESERAGAGEATESSQSGASAVWRRRLLLPLAVAVGVVLGAVGWAAAAGDSAPAAQANTSTITSTETGTGASSSDSGDWGPWGGPGRGGAWGGPWGGPWAGGHGGPLFDRGAALHGEVVLSKSGGGTETVLIQRGEVSAVSASSITLKSSDGFTQSYALNADTLVNGQKKGSAAPAVKKAEEAVVSAVKSGSTVTARYVIH
jgi:hypothetical protein